MCCGRTSNLKREMRGLEHNVSALCGIIIIYNKNSNESLTKNACNGGISSSKNASITAHWRCPTAVLLHAGGPADSLIGASIKDLVRLAFT